MGGYQCTKDSDCNGCGTAGTCSCPDGQNVSFFQESCSCVSTPANPPKSPVADVTDSVWPKQWTADVDAFGYGTFADKTQTATGKFYYDEVLGKTRADWKPYTNGHNAKQIWISSNGGTSTYYVKMNLVWILNICLKFPISDPGANKAPVGVEKSDWMKQCKDAGFAHYVGREQVHVDETNTDEWVDHWSCRLDYAAANQSITFQNWHSLGLGKLPKGLPLRVTGGNSAPNPTQGSPRLNSVWYKNFVTGPNATSATDFSVDDFHLCIPLGKSEVKEHFGYEVTAADTFSPDFHRRAHYLPIAKASTNDMKRAQRPKPGSAFVRDNFANTMRHLNGVLTNKAGLQTRPCSNFTGAELRDVQRELFDARTVELDKVYQKAKDTRRMAHSTTENLERAHAHHSTLEKDRPDLVRKMNDGLCHEAVMWYIHHLSERVQEEIKDRLVLPLLPEVQHGQPSPMADDHTHGVHARYESQVSCAICHVAGGEKSPTITV